MVFITPMNSSLAPVADYNFFAGSSQNFSGWGGEAKNSYIAYVKSEGECVGDDAYGVKGQVLFRWIYR